MINDWKLSCCLRVCFEEEEEGMGEACGELLKCFRQRG
jgi:hypothetical protein